ncbi:MAG: TIGR04086 family membrane protein [Oscillospiraceae bacterium]|nr:TIGR04086 family membrane protein [Oscillospiraceae bacterium]
MEKVTRSRGKGTPAKRQGRERGEPQGALQPLLRRVLLGAGFGAVLFCVLLLPLAAVCLRLDLQRELLPLAAMPPAGLAAAVAGYCSVRPTRKQGLPTGMLAAGALYVVLLLASWLTVRGSLGLNAVVLLLLMLLGGALGGILAANKTVKSRKNW